MCRVPQELVDEILHNLRDDIPALKRCSIAASMFFMTARSHIFRKLEVEPHAHPRSFRSCQQRYKFLITYPHLARLVQELCVIWTVPPAPKTQISRWEINFDLDDSDEEHDYLRFRSKDAKVVRKQLPLILNLLDLKKISLVASGSVKTYVIWSFLEEPLDHALSTLLRSQNLQSVHIRGAIFRSPRHLLSLLSTATCLRELSLSRILYSSPVDEWKSWPESEQWRPSLEILLLSEIGSHSLCECFVNSQIDLTHLHTLTIATDRDDSRNALMREVSNRVEHLKLQLRLVHDIVDLTVTTSQGRLDVATMFGLNLRSLHISTTYLYRLMNSFFHVCPRDSLLESLIFEGPACKNYDQLLDDTIELAVVHLRSLKKVEIRAVYLVSPGADSAMLSTHLRFSLPSLEKRATNQTPPGWE
ncbi:hypothetical protein R3P38DRAFT_3378688 [Favolaschia claudopus]|uniref:F-box domain-containing protein n=1 Tax=Favolaschia claudopus TaxID=2862362 RepID=A0AAV9Z7H6_9AGAR